MSHDGSYSDKNKSGTSGEIKRTRPARRDILKSIGAAGATVSMAGCISSALPGGSGGGDNTFTIGGIWALSQGWGTWGKMQQQHTELAVKQINEEGGIDGREVELIIEDTQIDPQTATQKARKLVQQNNADVLVGPNSSSSRAAISKIANENEVPHLYPLYYEGIAAPDYCRNWLLKFSGVPYGSVKPVVPYLMNNYGDSFYLIGADYVWPRTTNKQIKNFVGENGGEIVGETYVQINSSDYSSILPQIADADPDIVWSTLTGGAIPFQQQAFNRGLRENWQEVHMSLTPLGLIDKDPEPFQGVLEPHVYYPSQSNSENEAMVSALQDEYGDELILDTIGGVFYTAVRSLPTAVENGGGTENSQILSGYEQLEDYQSPMGSLSMGPDHQARLTYKLAEVQMEPDQPSWQAHQVQEQFGPVAPPDECSDI